MTRHSWTAAAVLLLGSAAARAQLTCSPAHLHAGDALHVASTGAFGGSPSSDVVLTYRNTAGGTATRFGTPRSWSASDVVFTLPAGVAVGTYEVVLASPAGALRNPACFTVDPPLVAITTIRGPAPGVARPSLRSAVADDPCTIPATVHVRGELLPVGATLRYDLAADGPEPSGGWGRYYYGPTTVHDAERVDLYVFQCFLAMPHPRVRLRFPDGTLSAWIDVSLSRLR